jgi:diamine N-acetyltransferase
MMWAVDKADGSCWLGGILVDQAYQRQGYGRQAVRAAVMMLSETEGYQDFALSYHPSNTAARHLYETLGFEETGEWEGDEIVARLTVDDPV